MRCQLIASVVIWALAETCRAQDMYCGDAPPVFEADACYISSGGGSPDASGSYMVSAIIYNVNANNGSQLGSYLRDVLGIPSVEASPGAGLARSARPSVLAGVTGVKPLHFFDNIVMLEFSKAFLQAQKIKLQDLPRLLQKEVNKKLKALPKKQLPNGQEFRADYKKAVTAHLEVSQQLRFHSRPNDEDFPGQWSLQSGINATETWDRLALIPEADLQPITIAVIDSGINPNQKDLKSSDIEKGCDLVTLNSTATSFPAQPVSVCPAVKSKPSDHGTAVIGVIAAASNNLADNNDPDVAGATWAGKGTRNLSRILPVELLIDEHLVGEQPNGACTHNLWEALRFAVDPEGETIDQSRYADLWDLTKSPPDKTIKPARGAKVINMSFSFGRCSPDTAKLFDRIAHNFPEVLLVSAVDTSAVVNADLDAKENGRRIATDFPASYLSPANPKYDNLLTVTFSDEKKLINGVYGNQSVDIAAPGVDWLLGQEGSSFAAPLVSSVAAILKSLAPDWGFAKIRDYIMASRNTDLGYDEDLDINWDLLWPKGGVLDMNAATMPSVKFIEKPSEAPDEVLKPGVISTSTHWVVGSATEISWKIASLKLANTGLCPNLLIEMQMANAIGNWPNPWTPLDHATGDKKGYVQVTVPDLGLVSGSDEQRPARLRLRCKDTQIFRVSKVFTVSKN